MADLSIAIEILGKDSFSSVAGGVQKAAGGILGGFKELGLGIFGITQTFDVAKGAIEGLIGPAIDAQQVASQTAAVLKSTGEAAGLSANDIADLAGGLSKLTPFEDEAIQSAENLLLTFTNIGGEVFPQATETVLDMSQALGQDLKSSSVQLGKALNDPIKGITALSRVGVSFTEEQKDQIKTLQESGDMMGAQGIILAELNKEFGGAAKAAGQTFGGQMVILQTAVGNVAEAIGGPLVKGLSTLATAALPAVQAFADELPGAIDSFMESAQPVVDFLGKTISEAVLSLASAFTGLDVSDFTDPFQALGQVVTFAQAYLMDFQTFMAPFVQTVTDAWGTIQQVFAGDWSASDAIDPVVNLVGELATVVRDGAKTVSDAWTTVQQVFANDWSASDQIDPLVNGIGILATVVRDDAIPAVEQLGAFILNPLGTSLNSATQFLHDNVGAQAALVGVLGSAATAWGLTSAAATAAALQTSIVGAATKAYTGVQAALNIVLTANPLGLLVVGLAGVAAGLVYAYNSSEDFRNVVDGAMSGATAAIGGLVDFVKGVPAAIEGFTGAVGGFFDQLGTTVSGAMDTVGQSVVGGWEASTATALGLVEAFQVGVGTIWGMVPEDIRSDLELIGGTLTTRFADFLGDGLAWGQNMANAIGQTWTTAVSLTQQGWGLLSGTVTTAVGGVLTTITGWSSGVLGRLTALATGVGTEATTAATNLTTPITRGLSDTLNAVTGWATSSLGVVTGLAGDILKAAGDVGKSVIDGMTGALNAGRDGLGQLMGDIARGLISSVKSVLGIASPSTAFASIGEDILGGIRDGMSGALNGLQTWVTDNLANALPQWVKTVLGIHSPSSVFAAIGGNIIAGLEVGLTSRFSDTQAVVRKLMGGLLDSVNVGSGAVQDYIANVASSLGIDPQIALQVVASEGGFDPSGWVGDHGSSFGPFQLHYGGIADGGNAVGGMGDSFTAATGLFAGDFDSWPAQVLYALQQAKQGGWGPWHGYPGGNWDGIEGRMLGGFMEAGRDYLVGERHPEVISVGSNSWVHPNPSVGVGGGDVYNISIDARGLTGSAHQMAENLGNELESFFVRKKQRGGRLAWER